MPKHNDNMDKCSQSWGLGDVFLLMCLGALMYLGILEYRAWREDQQFKQALETVAEASRYSDQQIRDHIEWCRANPGTC